MIRIIAIFSISLTCILSFTQAGISHLGAVGLGLETSASTVRERGMGHAGLASVSPQILSYWNYSRSAFLKQTSFMAVLEYDLVHVQGPLTSNRLTSTSLPLLGLDFQAGPLGKLGLLYYQRFMSRFDYRPFPDNSTLQQSIELEGGAFELMGYWSYSPSPYLALGAGLHWVLGQQRNIQHIDYEGYLQDSRLLYAQDLSDTVVSTREGFFPSVSITGRTRRVNLAIFFQLGTDLDVTVRRGVSNLRSNTAIETETTLPWSLGGGIEYRLKRNQSLVFDGIWKAWDESEYFFDPDIRAGMGYEFVAGGGPFDAYFRRMSYRAGLGAQQHAYQQVPHVFATTGLGFPLGKGGKMLDISLEYGHRGNVDEYLFAEDYAKIAVSLNGVGEWGQSRRKR